MVYNFYLKSFEHNILNQKGINTIDKLLLCEFKKAIKVIEENWDIYKEKFLTNIEYTFSIEEQMTFTILVSKLGNNLLDKDPEFTSELINSLIYLNKSPFYYEEYAKLFYQDKIYNGIINFINDTSLFNYHSLIMIILSKLESPELNEENYNYIMRIISKLNNEAFTILIDDDDNLFSIYSKLKKFMDDNNKKTFIFIEEDYIKLNIILSIIKENDIELTKKVIEEIKEIENKYNKKREIVRNILKLLDSLKKEPTLIRSKHE